jgi:hypothetical protein
VLHATYHAQWRARVHLHNAPEHLGRVAISVVAMRGVTVQAVGQVAMELLKPFKGTSANVSDPGCSEQVGAKAYG